MTATLKTTNIQHESAATANITLTSDGNVGIGTASPTQKLIVTGTTGQIATVNSTAGETQFCVDGGGVAGRMYATDGGSQLIVGTFSNHLMSFYTNSTEKMRIDSSGNLKFNSGYGSVGTAYGCRVWVQYNGTNGTVNGSGNVSSVTDNGTGDFTVNFTNAMPDTNYSWAIGYSSNPGAAQRNRGFFELENISTGSSRIYQTDNNGSAWDMTTTTFQVFR